MHIQRISVSKIDPAPYNPRKDLRPGDPSYQRLLKSVEEFGLVEPLVWNKRTGHLVGGHQRFKILLARGATHAQVSVVDLPLEREKALNLALNNAAGEWDRDRLSELLAELSTVPDLDLETTGFGSAEIEQLLAGMDSAERAAEDGPAATAIAEAPPVTAPGDLIDLGPHRLLCADATDPESWARLLEDRKAALVFTDPPYNVAYDASARPTAKRAKGARSVRSTKPGALDRAGSARFGPIRGDAAGGSYARWFERLAGLLAQHTAPGAPFYLWNGHANFGLMHRSLAKAGFKHSCVLTWAKETFSPGFGDYNQQTEFCLYGWRKGAKRPWHGPDNESTLWQVRRDPAREYVHPTQKALELAERALRNSSRRGDLVLDPFLGSGTTLVASARLGRVCRGMELDPRHCDSIVRRYIALAGRSAVAPELADRYAAVAEHAPEAAA